MSATVEQVLDQAATRLAVSGWMQGHAGPQAGPNCLIGAIRWSAEELGASYISPMILLRQVCSTIYPQVAFGTVSEVNDWYLHDAGEAIALLEKARALAGERGL